MLAVARALKTRVLPLQGLPPGLYMVGIDCGAGERMIRLEMQ